MRIDSSGNVLINTTDASTLTAGIKLRASDNAIAAVVTSNPSGYFGRLSTDGEIVKFRRDSTTVGGIGSYLGSYLYMGSTGGTDTHINFVNGNVRPATSTGAHLDNSLALGHSQSRWSDVYVGGGVYLGGTGTANKLDDYEEGTWTPTLSSGTATVDKAGYIKIGNKVTVWTNMNNFSDKSSSGNVEIRSLPFTANTTYDASAVGSSLWSFVDNSESTTTYLTPASALNFYGAHSAGFSALKYNELNNTATSVYLTATYYTQ
jgi:hypothetical protein